MYQKHQMIPRGALSWDNSGNNKVYQGKQVAFAHDSLSIFSSLLIDDKELADRTGLFPAPGGPGGRPKMILTDYYAVFKASPYPEIAKGLIRYLMEPARHKEFIVATQGRYLPAYPKLTRTRSGPRARSSSRFARWRAKGGPLGWEGRMSPAFGEVVAQSLLGKAVHTMLVDNLSPGCRLQAARGDGRHLQADRRAGVARPPAPVREPPLRPVSGPAERGRCRRSCPAGAGESRVLDLVITGGLVLDGTGTPAAPADVGVTGGRIVAVGRLAGVRAARVIRADGRIVCPGFIDMHAHDDFDLPVNLPLAVREDAAGRDDPRHRQLRALPRAPRPGASPGYRRI